MKKLIVILISILFLIGLAACDGTSLGSEENPENRMDFENDPTDLERDGKTLIVYFSWSSSGNTEKMANVIKEQTGGDMYELIPLKSYPEDYTECTEVALEERDNNARPEIQNLLASIEGYERIYIGYPIWWHTAPMIIGTFLESYDLTGVEIYPFSQSASMNSEQFQNSMEFIRACAGNANVHDGLFVSANDTEEIISYLNASVTSSSQEDGNEVSTENLKDEPTSIPILTSTPEPTPEPTNTPIPTPEPTSTPMPTPTPTPTPEPTNTPIPTPEPTGTPIPTPTPEPTNMPIPTPEPTGTPIPTSEPEVQAGKALIVYFSWSSSGNTEKMANVIKEQTGGDIYELLPLNPYPENYTRCTEVALEERDNNARPEIKDPLASLEGYDRIYIGYPKMEYLNKSVYSV